MTATQSIVEGEPDFAQIALNAIRHPVIVVAPDDRISFANMEAESFFNSSQAILARNLISDIVPFGSPLLALIDQVREEMNPVNDYRVDISSPRIGGDKLVDLHVSPIAELPGAVIILLVGWFVARIVRDVVTNLLASTGLDNLATRAGFSGPAAPRRRGPRRSPLRTRRWP